MKGELFLGEGTADLSSKAGRLWADIERAFAQHLDRDTEIDSAQKHNLRVNLKILPQTLASQILTVDGPICAEESAAINAICGTEQTAQWYNQFPKELGQSRDESYSAVANVLNTVLRISGGNRLSDRDGFSQMDELITEFVGAFGRAIFSADGQVSERELDELLKFTTVLGAVSAAIRADFDNGIFEPGGAVETAQALAEELARLANEALRAANASLDVRLRVAKTNETQDYLRRIKQLTIDCPSLTITSLDSFEASIHTVEVETARLRGDPPPPPTQTLERPTARASIPLRITKIAELHGSVIAFSKNFKPRGLVAALTNSEVRHSDGPQWGLPLVIGEGAAARPITIDLAPLISQEDETRSDFDPIIIELDGSAPLVLFRRRFFLSERHIRTDEEREEVTLRAKKFVYDDESDLISVRASVANMEAAAEFRRAGPKREVVRDDVKLLVWSRDGGNCTRCGSTEQLHFDHIIPVAKGGSGEAVNIQLLCQPCNLKKSDKIAF